MRFVFKGNLLGFIFHYGIKFHNSYPQLFITDGNIYITDGNERIFDTLYPTVIFDNITDGNILITDGNN